MRSNYKQSSDISLWVTCLLSLLILSGCGFQLRGAYHLPEAMQTTYIETVQPKSDFIRSLKRSLKSSGINISDNASENAAVLKIFKEQKRKRILSVDSKGRAREYALTYAVSFSIKNLQKEFEIEKQTIQIDRDFVFDTEDVLGNSREEAKLYQEMQQDLLRLLLLRLQSKGR